MSTRKIRPVIEITKATRNHKGRIRGNSKKETKLLRRACPHHRYNKKGKLKPTIINRGDGVCVCEMCGAEFPTQIVKKGEIKDVMENMLGYVDQALFASVSGDLSPKVIEELCGLKVMMHKFPKDYAKIMNVVSKEDNIRRKKKKNRGNYSSQYGGWGNR